MWWSQDIPHPCRCRLSGLAFVSFERYLQHPIAERVSIQTLDGHQRLLVVGHGDEAEAFAFVRLQVAYHLDALHGAERAEQLPKQRLLRVGREVVDEDAPATGAAVQRGRVRRQDWIGEDITGQRGISVLRGWKRQEMLVFGILGANRGGRAGIYSGHYATTISGIK